MQISDFYSVPSTTAQAANTPVSVDNNSAQPPATPSGQHWTVVTWFGIVLALVLLRIVYEVSD